MENTPVTITVMDNGPLLVKGEVTVIHKDGTTETRPETTALCRCGYSKNKPYCDGAHRHCDTLAS